MLPYDQIERFELQEDFLSDYRDREPDWGYGDFSKVVYRRTYSRRKEDGTQETWFDTARRVVEGVFNTQKAHCHTNKLPWDEQKARRTARRMFDRMYDMKWLPPGRGLWMMGTDFVENRGSAPLNNCGFRSTENIDENYAEPYCWAFTMSMLGVGVGFDTRGKGKVTIQEPTEANDVHVVEDSREGWTDALGRLLNSFVGDATLPAKWDYSEIRPKGAPIESFGGVASGPEPLKEMLETLEDLYRDYIGQRVDSRLIVDTMNISGKCVVSGGVRRCLAEGTRVHTASGVKFVEDVEEDDEVVTLDGTSDVVEHLDQGAQKTVRVEHQDGDLVCTPDHRMAVLEEADGTYTWKEAADLESGDRLIYRRHTAEGQSTDLPEWSYETPDGSTTSIDIEIPELDVQIGWFLGLLAADGTVRVRRDGSKGVVEIACNADDETNVSRSLETLSRFGVNPSVIESSDEHCKRVRASSNQLAKYFQKEFKVPGEQIRVPECIRTARPDIRRAYVAGVMDGDGCLTNNPLKVVDTIYREFAKDVQSLLYSIGVETRLYEHGDPPSRDEDWQELYSVNCISMHSQREVLSNPHLAKTIDREPEKAQYSNGFPADMVQKLDWSPSSKQMTTDCFEKIHGEIDVVPVEVEGVEENGEVRTYDLSVEGESSFLAEGVLVHNTAQIALSDPEDKQFLDLKQDDEKLQAYRWASNNSVFAEVGMDYHDVADRTADNGEPGYVWLENMRKYGRMADEPDWEDRDVMGFNPCKPLKSLIFSRDGYITFEEALQSDEPIEVVTPSGEVVEAEGPFKTGENREIVRVELSDGSEIYGTPDHEHRVEGRGWTEIADMNIGDEVESVDFAVGEPTDTDTERYELGIAMGWLWADGTMYERSDRENGYRIRYSIGEHEFGFTDRLCEILDREGKWFEHPQASDTCRLVDGVMDHARTFLDEGYSLDKSDLSWLRGKSASFKTGVLRAMFTTDGSVRGRNGCVELYSVHRDALLTVQNILREFGVASNLCKHQNAESHMAPDGRERNNKTTWKIAVRDDDFEDIGFLTDYKQDLFEESLEEREESSSNRDRTVTEIEREWDYQDVYDITVPTSEHAFIDSGVVTHNCVEQPLEDGELCTLVESFPAHHDTFEDYRKTLKVAYLYAKTVTLIPTHNQKTNQVMLKNRRIGCSQSGIVQDIEKRGLREHLRWCDEGYEYIQNIDRIYSEWLGVPKSIKTTSVKPSGCRPWYKLTATDEGLLTMEDLFTEHPEGDEWSDVERDVSVIQDDGTSRITKTYDNGTTPVYRAELSYGLTVESTPNHEWTVLTDDGSEWKRMDELEEGDVLDVELGTYDKSTPAELKRADARSILMRGDARNIRQPREMNEDLAWLLGFLWGDGAMSPHKYRLRFSSGRDADLEKAAAVIDEQFGLDVDPEETSGDRDCQQITVASKYLWHWLIKNGVWKYHADEIDLIPEVVRRSSRDHIVAFLGGLIDADGSVSFRGRRQGRAKFTYTTASKRFAGHVQDVCWAVGIGIGCSHNAKGQNWQDRKSIYLMTSAAHQDPEAFETLVDNSLKLTKATEDPEFEEWEWENASHSLNIGKVVDIEYVGEKPTFDVEVANDHWYRAGSVKSHNTVSQLAGSTPGVHFEHSPYFIRRLRVQDTSPIWEAAEEAGYPVEEDTYADDTKVIEFPLRPDYMDRSKSDVSIWEMVKLAALHQKWWSDNGVSCLTGDTLIETSNGFLRMDKLPDVMNTPSDPGVWEYNGPLRVLNADNEWSDINALVVNPPEETIRITSEGGHCLVGTGDHELRVLNDSLEFEWRSFDELEPGDVLAETVHSDNYPTKNEILNRKLQKYEYDGTVRAAKTEVPRKVTTELGEFLGMMSSDGFVKTDVGFGLSQLENSASERFRELVDFLFDRKVSVHRDERSEGELFTFTVGSTKVTDWLKWIGLYDNSGSKKVPWVVLQAGSKTVRAFLRGVTLDGHFSDGRIYVHTTENHRFAIQTSTLLKSLGFRPSIIQANREGYMVSPTNGKEYPQSKTWSVSIPESQSRRFLDFIGFAEERKRSTVDSEVDSRYVKYAGGVPSSEEWRTKMSKMRDKCDSHYFSEHCRNMAAQDGRRLKRDTLFQLSDMGCDIPDHLLNKHFSFRKVKEVETGERRVTYDIDVEDGSSYVANGFASHNCTVNFDEDEADQIPYVLEAFEKELKGISFLPSKDHGYEQAPYEEIDAETYEQRKQAVETIDLSESEHEKEDKFCGSEGCEVDLDLEDDDE